MKRGILRSRLSRRALAVFLFGIPAAYFGPYLFHEEALKRAYASLLSGPIAASFYPTKHDAPVIVFTVGDRDLRISGTTYPPPYEFHAAQLLSIAERKPRAIFVDIVFDEPRNDESISIFRKVLCHIHDVGVPIYLAAYSAEEKIAVRPDLLSLGPNDKTGCVQFVSISKDVDPIDRRAWTYPQFELDGNGERLSSGLSTAARTIFRDLYPATGSRLDEVSTKMGLVWGTAPAHSHLLHLTSIRGAPLARECRPWTPWELVPVGLRPGSFLQRDFHDRRSVCPYIASIPVRAFQLFNDEESESALVHDIRGKIAIYGFSLGGNSDLVASPVHGPLDGMQYHAMAIDNLISFNGHGMNSGDFDPFSRSPATLMPLSALSLIALYDILLARRFARRVRQFKQKLAGKLLSRSTVSRYLRRISLRGSGLFRLRQPTYLRALACVLRILEWPHSIQYAQKRPSRVEAIIAKLFSPAIPRFYHSSIRLLLFLSEKLATLSIFCALCFVLFSLSWYAFRVSILSWIEYAYLPLLAELFSGFSRVERILLGLRRFSVSVEFSTTQSH